MKLKSIIIAGLVILFCMTGMTSNAQQRGEPTVKILPSSKKGILRILYVSDSHKSVHVKFYSEDGLTDWDIIKEGTYHLGFIKKYDVSNVNSKVILLKVSDADISFTFNLIKSKNGQTYIPLLQRKDYYNTAFATNN